MFEIRCSIWYNRLMMQRSGALARLVFVDLIGSVLWFPIWWYTKGLTKFISWCYEGLLYRYKQYAFRVWIKNFFVPMYAQYDWTGRLISIGMRFFVILGRGIAIFIEALAYLFLVLCWCLVPPLAIMMALQNMYASIL
jgi:hypothetical protein